MRNRGMIQHLFLFIGTISILCILQTSIAMEEEARDKDKKKRWFPGLGRRTVSATALPLRVQAAAAAAASAVPPTGQVQRQDDNSSVDSTDSATKSATLRASDDLARRGMAIKRAGSIEKELRQRILEIEQQRERHEHEMRKDLAILVARKAAKRSSSTSALLDK